MQFKFIASSDLLIAKVIELGKKNSGTLGLMPRDAYIEQAKLGCLLVAYDGDNLIGFCLFRVARKKGRIAITQLCIDPVSRRTGVASALLDQVRGKFRFLLSGMLVSCREDYKEACNLWMRYGFSTLKRVRSRSVEEKYLLKLWYSFDQKDLFTFDPDPNDLNVVLDLNIIIKMRENQEALEVHQLLADWLTDEVQYYYAKETLNEIHRDKNFERANETIRFLKSFHQLTGDPMECQKFLPLLRALHPGETDNHLSDRKQLAESKASNIEYFITIDEELISNRDGIYEKLGISILRPIEFILEVDELKNRRLYEPFRLQGARYEVKRVDSLSLLSLIDLFLDKETSEKKTEFKSLILNAISDPAKSYSEIITSPEGDPIAFYGAQADAAHFDIVFARIKKLPIRNTLFSQLLVQLIRRAVAKKLHVIRFKERHITQDQEEILSRLGFIKANGHWEKIALSGIGDSAVLETSYPILKKFDHALSTLSLIRTDANLETRVMLKLDLERRLWPLKMSDLSIPVFVVPIKPLWASLLFDHLSANSTLFGASPELSWKRENVYYRSLRPDVESFPARILWYASEERGFFRQKALVGCSYLDKVVTGEAKQLFSIFRRYGIYQWDEIKQLAKGDIHKIIKVLQFSDTEVFQNPIGFKETNEILFSEGFKKQTFVSPVKVNTQVFNRIYILGNPTL